MKIALALPSFDPTRGDLEAFTFELARRLVALKNDVHVVAQHFSDSSGEFPIVPHRIRAVRSPLRAAAAAEAELESIDADVIHDLGLTWYADVFTSPVGSPTRMWQSQLAGISWWARPLTRIRSRLSLRFAQRAELSRRQLEDAEAIRVCFSEMVANDYRTLHGQPDSNVRVVYPGIDIKRFSPHIRKLRRETTRRKLGIDTKDLLLLSFEDGFQLGTWTATFRALRRLIAKEVPANLIITTAKDAGCLEQLADRYGVAKNVKVANKVSDRIPYYAAADVLVAATYYSPFNLAVLEAAACGLPSITTGQSGVCELFGEGAGGCVLERLTAVGLADRIESFVDPRHRDRMSQAARRIAMQHTFDRSVAKLVQIYEEVAEEQSEERILAIPPKAGCDSTTRRAA